MKKFKTFQEFYDYCCYCPNCKNSERYIKLIARYGKCQIIKSVLENGIYKIYGLISISKHSDKYQVCYSIDIKTNKIGISISDGEDIVINSALQSVEQEERENKLAWIAKQNISFNFAASCKNCKCNTVSNPFEFKFATSNKIIEEFSLAQESISFIRNNMDYHLTISHFNDLSYFSKKSITEHISSYDPTQYNIATIPVANFNLSDLNAVLDRINILIQFS